MNLWAIQDAMAGRLRCKWLIYLLGGAGLRAASLPCEDKNPCDDKIDGEVDDSKASRLAASAAYLCPRQWLLSKETGN
jgi:hypothetical protein